MRGKFQDRSGRFCQISREEDVHTNRPLTKIRTFVRRALKGSVRIAHNSSRAESNAPERNNQVPTGLPPKSVSPVFARDGLGTILRKLYISGIYPKLGRAFVRYA